MIATGISGNIIEHPISDGKLNVPVNFEWFEASKKRMRKVAEDGTEIGVMVGQTIQDGDVLAETDDKRYYARMKTAQLIEIPVHSMKEMGRLCFELGNRHLSLKVRRTACWCLMTIRRWNTPRKSASNRRLLKVDSMVS